MQNDGEDLQPLSDKAKKSTLGGKLKGAFTKKTPTKKTTSPVSIWTMMSLIGTWSKQAIGPHICTHKIVLGKWYFSIQTVVTAVSDALAKAEAELESPKPPVSMNVHWSHLFRQKDML